MTRNAGPGGGPPRQERPNDRVLQNLEAAAAQLMAGRDLSRAAAELPAPQLDTIRIEGLRVHAFHGVHEHERSNGQDFLIDAEVWLNTREAAASDNIDDTLHYGHLMRALADTAAGAPVDLIETLAERLAAAVFAFPEALAVRITVHKPSAPVQLPFKDVAVSILRFRPDREPER